MNNKPWTTDKKYKYEVSIEKDGQSHRGIDTYSSASPVADIISDLDNPGRTFEGTITVRRKKVSTDA